MAKWTNHVSEKMLIVLPRRLCIYVAMQSSLMQHKPFGYYGLMGQNLELIVWILFFSIKPLINVFSKLAITTTIPRP